MPIGFCDAASLACVQSILVTVLMETLTTREIARIDELSQSMLRIWTRCSRANLFIHL